MKRKIKLKPSVVVAIVSLLIGCTTVPEKPVEPYQIPADCCFNPNVPADDASQDAQWNLDFIVCHRRDRDKAAMASCLRRKGWNA